MGKGPVQTFLQRKYAKGQWEHNKDAQHCLSLGKSKLNHNDVSSHDCYDGCHQKDRRYIYGPKEIPMH